MICLTKDLFYALNALSQEDQIKIYQGFCQYVFDGTEPELDGTNKAIWILAKDYVHTARDRFGNKEVQVVKSKRVIFHKPTIEEIAEYIHAHHTNADMARVTEFAEQFYSFYESKDWMIGKSKMKNWMAALRTWKDTMQKVIYPKLKTHESFPKNSWESRQMEYLKGMNSILNDENP
jgi:hypothetical protein